MDSCVKATFSKERLYAEIRANVNNPGNFSGANQIYVVKLDEDYAEGEMIISERSLNLHGIVHGGCLTTLADTVAGTAVVTRGRTCVTLSSAMNYLAPARGTKIRCVATPQKVGKTICVYDCTLTDDAGQVVATGSFTFYVIPKCRFNTP